MLIALKNLCSFFSKAVNRVIEHFRGEGTLRDAAQPPSSRQGQLGGSGWITQGFGFESKPLRMEPAQPVWAGCSNVGLSWSQESFSFYAVGTTPVLIYACLSLIPTTPHCEKTGSPQKISLPHPVFPVCFLWRGCINPLQLSHLLTACRTLVPDFRKAQSLSFLSKYLFLFINS